MPIKAAIEVTRLLPQHLQSIGFLLVASVSIIGSGGGFTLLLQALQYFLSSTT